MSSDPGREQRKAEVDPPCACAMTCPVCDGSLRWSAEGDRWAVVGHDHSLEADLQAQAEAELVRIRDALLSALAAPKGQRTTMPSDAELNFYSVYSNAGTWSFRARIRHADVHEEGCKPLKPLPWCCRWPMQDTPLGWLCREGQHPYLLPSDIIDGHWRWTRWMEGKHLARMEAHRATER